MADDTKKTKNNRVKITYVDLEGKPTTDVREAHALQVEVAGKPSFFVNPGELPPEINRAAMIFGYNTRLRNDVNTSTTLDEGYERVTGSVDDFKSKAWRSAGGGGFGTPDIIAALVKATTDAGVHTEEKEAAWKETYAALDSRGKAAQTEEWLKKGPVRVAYDAIKLEKAQAALARAKAAGKANKASDLSGDLGDL
jgi:hypothetical protein